MRFIDFDVETSFVTDAVAPGLSATGVSVLRRRFLSSPAKIYRLCFHQDLTVGLLDCISVFDERMYIPPKKRVGKIESLLVLAGRIECFFFSDYGRLFDCRTLSTPASGLPFYVRMPSNTWFGVRALGPEPCLVKETIAGPHSSTSINRGAFSPDDAEGGLRWYRRLSREWNMRVSDCMPDEVFERVEDGVFRSVRQVVTVSSAQLQPIVDAAGNSSLRRARLCCHGGVDESLHEMFIALARGVELETSVHLRKDESLTVISGIGTYIFPNENGTVRKAIPLGSIESEVAGEDRSVFLRVNRYVPHRLVVGSDVLVIHEATTGPFRKSDTDYPKQTNIS